MIFKINGLLVQKNVLLDAIVSTHASDVGGISKILGIKKSNLHRAIERCRFLQVVGASTWALSRRKKRLNGLNEETKNMFFFWWISKTKVSLDKRDVAYNRIRPKQYEEHAIHFLLESQVNWYLVSTFITFILHLFQKAIEMGP